MCALQVFITIIIVIISFLLLGNMDDNMMKEVTNAIYRDWRTIAFNLYLSKEDLEHIDRKCHSEKDRTEQMLRMWLKQKTGFDKISKLANACRTCSLHDLANELEQGMSVCM